MDTPRPYPWYALDTLSLLRTVFADGRTRSTPSAPAPAPAPAAAAAAAAAAVAATTASRPDSSPRSGIYDGHSSLGAASD